MMTEDRRSQLADRCEKHITWLMTLTPEAMTVCNSVKEQLDIYGIALAALTQPASPALTLPWSENTCRECGSKSLSWGFAIINKSTVQNGLLRISDVDGLFYLGCDECSETVAKVSPDEVVELLSALQKSINAPHTAPIEPICATGGAEWVSNERVEEIIYRAEMFGHGAGYLPDEVIQMAKELLALRKAFSEPYGYTDKDAYGMVYEPRHKERLRNPAPLYRKP